MPSAEVYLGASRVPSGVSGLSKKKNEAYNKLYVSQIFTLDFAEEDGYDVTGYLKPIDIDSNDQDPKFCSLYAANMYDSFHVAEV